MTARASFVAVACSVVITAGAAGGACGRPAAPPVGAGAASPASAARASEVTEVLQRQTQELVDAIAAGRAEVWDRYAAPDLIYTAEDGVVKTKADLLKEVRPLPSTISGRLRVTDLTARVRGGTAVASYLVDEHETYYGQSIEAKYRVTDTWIETADGWRLLGTQVLAVLADPPPIELAEAQLQAYVGTYALTPEVKYTIRREGGKLVGQRTGREPEALQAEVADLFFVRGAPRLRKVFQRDASGAITGFVERREMWDIRWRRE